NQDVCFGYVPDEITLSGNSAAVQYWQRSANADFSNPQTINVTGNVLTGENVGAVTATTYFRAVVGNGICNVRYSDPITIYVRSTTWNGTFWDNGLPTHNIAAVIAGPYNVAADIDACSLTIFNNANVVIPEGFNVTISGSIIINSGSFTMENDANLVQTSDAINYGEINIKRKSSSLFRLDYTMWGSPLIGSQTLLNFSPLTFVNRFYTMNNGSGVFSVVNAQNTFSPGTGYLIRMPDNHVSHLTSTVSQTWTGIFTGTPVNGPLSVPIFTGGDRFNMVANPYPSVISADEMLQQNEDNISGTIYFWRRRNNVPTGTEGTNAYYATYTSVGGTAVAASGSESSEVPNGFIRVGQGFIVQSLENPSAANINFNNSMRTDQGSTQFFRSASVSNRSRIWINVDGPQGMFGQTLLAYTDEASFDTDRADGKYINDGTFALTSLIGEMPYIIQARPFANLVSDVVPMHFRSPMAGIFSISLHDSDGVFTNGQDVFVRDNLTASVHNLSNGAYNFTAASGSLDTRFDILFSQPLSTSDPVAGNDIIVYKANNALVVESALEELDEVEVYDISGRLLVSKRRINSRVTEINVTDLNQILIVKIKIGQSVITRKFIN
ncbi:MAG: T9SS type A sorting domain-containing protein, partial [Flavobacterium sp.]|nr:T9SS type A sorting domain-containing protein [Flavobacterium sp.]